VRKKKKINRERKVKDLPPLPDNNWTQALGIFITFNVVMLSFLLFSGFLDQLWFPKTAGK
jgi:membrane protein involved in D-alanine export